MKAVGVITEYNPLHSGHILHINMSKSMSAADVVVCVMSGDYVQRGEPAIIDKFSRARMALESGVDLVVELPVEYCLSSAEGFAEGAVTILNNLHIDSLCFGCEDADASSMYDLADILLNETDDFKKCLTKHLNQGMSYAAARKEAVSQYTGGKYDKFISKSNNILGIEYIKAVKKHNFDIKFLPVNREGADYNDEVYSDLSNPSATSIRTAILNGRLEEIALPSQTREVISNSSAFPVFFDDFSNLLYYKLEQELIRTGYNKEEFVNILSQYKDISTDMAGKIYNEYTKNCNASCYPSLSAFAQKIKTKQYALSRIKRALLRIVLDLSSDASPESFIRSLGFAGKGREYLSYIKTMDENVPIITKVADYKELYYSQIHAHNVYRQVCNAKFGVSPVSDYLFKPIIIND